VFADKNRLGTAWLNVPNLGGRREKRRVDFQGLRRRYSAFAERAFIPREVFFRSGDRFHHIRVTTGVQKLAALAGFLVLGWFFYASLIYVVHSVTLIAKNDEIERHKLAYFDLLAEVSEYHNQFARITGDLEQNQAYLLSLLKKDPESRNDLPSIQGKLKTSDTEHARVVIARDGLRQRMEQFESDLQEINNRNISLRSKVSEMRDMLHDSEAERDQVAQAREQLVQRLSQVEEDLARASAGKQELETILAGLRAELGETEGARAQLVDEKADLNKNIAGLEQNLGEALAQRARLDDEISGLNSSLAKAVDQGEKLERQRAFLKRRVGGLEQRLVDLRDAEKNVVERLSEHTKFTIAMVEKTIEMTGLDVNKMIAGTHGHEMGKGGPFIPEADEAAEFEPSIQLETSVNLLDQQLNRWAALQKVLSVLPLAPPLDQYRISSGYGPRKDPVNGRKARHEGIDFAAPSRSPVYVTAPGKVVFAGWKGRFGRTIEIDHGHGIRTRYGHLRKILVKVGETVENRQKIGLVGSSGRSTGPHVHYEVRYKGTARNPRKFIKAGNHVFKS
jgi:murein DD-endopeptidase MepM/ murein hydrolase activator NlpD